MTNHDVLKALREAWYQWSDIKETVTHFGFRDYIRAEWGIDYSGNDHEFSYTIVDKKKFIWFALRNKL